MNPPTIILGGGVHGKACWLIAYNLYPPQRELRIIAIHQVLLMRATIIINNNDYNNNNYNNISFYVSDIHEK